MALTATVHNFDVALSDVDRGVYDTLSLKVARHPSETAEALVTRVLAYALEVTDGLVFCSGLSTADEPALWDKDLTGQLRAWIEVGTPDAARLHKASKACGRVRVYCHKDVGPYFRLLAGQKVHAPERVEIVEVDRALVAELAARLEKRTSWALSVSDGAVYVDVGGASLNGVLTRHALPG